MYVVKRNGQLELMKLEKIDKRIRALCHGLDVDPMAVTLPVVKGLYSGVTTAHLDNLAAETAATMITIHPDYGTLAARLVASNLHKETVPLFSQAIEQMSGIISDKHSALVNKHRQRLDSAIFHERDYDFNYFGLRTLEKSYLLRVNGKIVERPQYLLMRVALGIHGDQIEDVLESYKLMSLRYFTHASSTLFSAGTRAPRLSSCFLLNMRSDSIDGIFDTIKQCALISQASGGIGISVNCIRAKGSEVGINGSSNGLVPLLRVLNNVSRYVDQGGGKRPGAFAAYLEPWHPDIFDFLDLKKNTGKEEMRARELFYALWIPDLFMRRVKEDGDWALFCPNKCPGLDDTWGDQFDQLYLKYERDERRAVRVVKAQTLWLAIVESQVETGTPYILFKDACNRKSNQQHLGTIKCSNLCTEIVQYSSPDEVAVCNLASIALNCFVTQDLTFDFERLRHITAIVTKNLNRVIDVTDYPVEEARRSNMRHRPIGIGVQGLADAFILMRIPYDSEEAAVLNRQIFETIYYSALETSCDLARTHGTYESYRGSPVSRGILQPDMWNVVPSEELWNWPALRLKISEYGVRNSLLVAPMPTASTAQILGNNESFEPYSNNIYTRRVLSGEFQVVNSHLLKDLIKLGLWNDDMKNTLIANRGSVQNISGIPQHIKDLYKTVWEISGKRYINMAAERGAFIDQSQSLNIHVAEPNFSVISSVHFYSWSKGLKTGMYYLRTKPAANAIQFTCTSKQDCLSCGS